MNPRVTRNGLIAVFAGKGSIADLTTFYLSPFGGTLGTNGFAQAPPTFTRNGNPLAINAALGGIASEATSLQPWCMFQPAVTPDHPLLSTDVITISTYPGWAICTAGALPPVTNMACPNYMGILEPSPGAWGPNNMGPLANQTWIAPGFDDPTRNLQIGYNGTWECWATNGSPASYIQNLIHRQLIPSTIRNHDGTPTQITAASKIPIITAQNGSILIDQRGGVPQGFRNVTYTFMADETNAAAPMTANFTITGGTIVSQGSTPGTPSGGSVLGKTWFAVVNYKTPITTLELSLTLNIFSPGGLYPKPWTLQNMFVQWDGQTPQNTVPFQLDANMKRFLTSPSGKSVVSMRGVDTLMSYNGNTSMIMPNDVNLPTDLNWSNKKNTYATAITTIRQYDQTISPYLYFDTPYAGTTPAPPGSPAAYQMTAPLNGGDFINFGGHQNQGWAIAELVTATPHGWKAGQDLTLTADPSLNAITFSNGPPPATRVVKVPTAFIIFPTGPNTALGTTFIGGFAAAYPAPQWINGVVGSFAVNTTGTITTPDAGSIPHGVMAAALAQLPNTNFHCNVASYMSDALITQIATSVRDMGAVGREVWLEVDNEPWLTQLGSTQYQFCLGQINAFGPGPLMGLHGALAGRCAQVKTIFQNVFNATDIHGNTNRGGEIKLSMNVGFITGSSAQAMTGANTYNSNYVPLGNPSCDVDAVMAAYYATLPQTTILTNPNNQQSLSIGTFFAAMYPTAPDSLAVGTAYPSTREQCCDILRYFTLYDTGFNGPTGAGQDYIVGIGTYIPTANQGGPTSGFRPVVYGYEGSYQRICQRIFNSTSFPGSLLSHAGAHDLFYCPEQQYVQQAYLQTVQQFQSWTHILSLIFERFPATTGSSYVQTWGDYFRWDQLAGTGDGTDGNPVNLFYDFNGAGTASATGLCQDHVNVSPRALGTQKWMDLANPAVGPGSSAGVGSITLGSMAGVGAALYTRHITQDSQLIDAGRINASLYSNVLNTPKGSGALQLVQLSVSASPGFLTPGVGVITLGQIAISSTTSLNTSSSGAITLGQLVINSNTTANTSSVGASTLGSITAAGSSLDANSSGSLTLGQLTINVTPSLDTSSAGAVTLGALTVTSFTIVLPPSANGASQLAPLVVTAAASFINQGVSTITLGSLVGAGGTNFNLLQFSSRQEIGGNRINGPLYMPISSQILPLRVASRDVQLIVNLTSQPTADVWGIEPRSAQLII